MVRVNKKPFIITIVILIIIILGLGGLIVYDNFFKEEDNVKVVTMVDDVDINLNAFYQVSETLSRFEKAFNNPGTNYFGYIYNTKKIEVGSFDQNAALYAAIAKDLIPSNINQTIITSKVKENFEKIFGNRLKYNPTEIAINNNTKINYDVNSATYSYILPTSSNIYSFEYITKNTKTILQDDNIIITQKLYYAEYNGTGNEVSKATIYTNSNKNQKLGEVSVKGGHANTEEVFGKYESKLETFDITFTKNSDEDYTFSKIERIK